MIATARPAPDAEWLEPDGLGGFASGTVCGIRTRRYHALLLAATVPPAGRVALVNGIEAWVESGGQHFALSSQRYAPDVVHPDGRDRIVAFESEPWPQWIYRLGDDSQVGFELFVPHGEAAAVLSWRRRGGGGPARLVVRPLLSGRDSHALHHENAAFRFDPEARGDRIVWRPYPGVPGVEARSNGTYRHAPDWYRNFLYSEERARGLDHVEDLAAPGEFAFDLSADEALLVLAVERGAPGGDLVARVRRWRAAEQRRRAAFASPLHRAADAYVVARGDGKTIVAGYPWFTDWGRDTFIALRGLCLATRRLAEAGAILNQWAGYVSEGMLPNRFPEQGEPPEYNSVDASLWFVVAVHEYLAAFESRGVPVAPAARGRLEEAVGRILSAYAAGTRFGIRVDEDGLLACGEPGVALTWMDARIGDRPVTPRIGKPVEVEALWINALGIGAAFSERWRPAAEAARQAFHARFFDEARGHLLDVVDVDHVAGTADPTLRPNQVLALGGLPFAVVSGTRARRALEAIESRLWTPMGLRSLDPAHPEYRPRCEGGALERDAGYHQGAVWPWLTGAFVEAWVRAQGATPEVKAEAWARFVEPYRAHLGEAGLGHVSEIADGEAPHTPRGCPFQAWSVGELLRLGLHVLTDRARPGHPFDARAEEAPA